jgi:hypothetical protein
MVVAAAVVVVCAVTEGREARVVPLACEPGSVLGLPGARLALTERR